MNQLLLLAPSCCLSRLLNRTLTYGARIPMLQLRGIIPRCLAGDALPNHPPLNLTVATTGASGSIFLRHFLLAVACEPQVQTVNFIASDSGLRVLAEELGLRGRSNLIAQILGVPAEPAPSRLS